MLKLLNNITTNLLGITWLTVASNQSQSKKSESQCDRNGQPLYYTCSVLCYLNIKQTIADYTYHNSVVQVVSDPLYYPECMADHDSESAPLLILIKVYPRRSVQSYIITVAVSSLFCCSQSTRVVTPWVVRQLTNVCWVTQVKYWYHNNINASANRHSAVYLCVRFTKHNYQQDKL